MSPLDDIARAMRADAQRSADALAALDREVMDELFGGATDPLREITAALVDRPELIPQVLELVRAGAAEKKGETPAP